MDVEKEIIKIEIEQHKARIKALIRELLLRNIDVFDIIEDLKKDFSLL